MWKVMALWWVGYLLISLRFFSTICEAVITKRTFSFPLEMANMEDYSYTTSMALGYSCLKCKSLYLEPTLLKVKRCDSLFFLSYKADDCIDFLDKMVLLGGRNDRF
jgi:hypothetical protein